MNLALDLDVGDAAASTRKPRGWPKGKPSPRKGIKLGPNHRTSPMRAPLNLPPRPEVHQAVTTWIYPAPGSSTADARPVTRIRRVVDADVLPEGQRSVLNMILTRTWDTSGECSDLGYREIAEKHGRSKRWAFTQVAKIEARGYLETEPQVVHRQPRWNGYNKYRPRVPASYLPPTTPAPVVPSPVARPGAAATGTAAPDPAASATAAGDARVFEPVAFVSRADWSPELNAIGALLSQHTRELPVGIEQFAPRLWSFACEKRHRYSLARVLVGIEHAADYAEELRGRALKNFIKRCIANVRDGEAPSADAKALLHTAEADQGDGRRAPPPAPRNRPTGAQLALAPPAAPSAAPPVEPAPPSVHELLAFLSQPQTYDAIVARWPGLGGLLIKLLAQKKVANVDGLWIVSEGARPPVDVVPPTGPP